MKLEEKDYVGKIYESKLHGPYVILRKVPDEDYRGNTIVEIQFLKSKCIMKTRLTYAIHSRVKDPQCGIELGKTYWSNNYGPFVVESIQQENVDYDHRCLIRFLNTGNRYGVRVVSVFNGEINDPGAPIVPLNTNLMDPEDKAQRLMYKANSVWRSMYDRCYNPKSAHYDVYGGAGVRICDRWLNEDNFINDLPLIRQYEKWAVRCTLYTLDKDMTQLHLPRSQRIYSPETCTFLCKEDNINLRIIEQNKIINGGSLYIGVTKTSNNTFMARISINNVSYVLGTYSNEIAAANVYNIWYSYNCYYELVPLLNDVPKMTLEECLQYKLGDKTICAKPEPAPMVNCINKQ